VEFPPWLGVVDRLTPWKAFTLGGVLAICNPKTALLTIAAGIAIAAAGSSNSAHAGALVVFVAIASVGVLTPLGVYLATGQRAARILDGWRLWFTRNHRVILSILFGIFGLSLLSDALSTL
jgi:threonine/homoserine/homoserine lactone efflux protein